MLVRRRVITSSVAYQKNEFDEDTMDTYDDNYVFVIPTVFDYIDYYYSLETQEKQQLYDSNKEFKEGFDEAIKVSYGAGSLDDLDETDTTFQEFLQDRYGN